MSYGNSPLVGHRRSGRYDGYHHSRGREYSSDIEEFRRPRGGAFLDDRRGRVRPDDYEVAGAFSPNDHRASRSVYDGDRKSGRFAGGSLDGSLKPCRVLGIFGLSTRTEERHLYDIMSAYGALEDIQIVYDSLTGRSRGFAFAYFEHLEDARAARAACARGLELHGRELRVDYSKTLAPHQSTPGIYMGKDKRRFRNFPGRDRRPSFNDRRFARPRSRTPLSPRRRFASNGVRASYHRRPRVESSSRSRSPPAVYSPRRRGRAVEPVPRHSPSPVDDAHFGGPLKDDQPWSDESGSPR